MWGIKVARKSVVEQILVAIMPYMITKRRQAELALPIVKVRYMPRNQDHSYYMNLTDQIRALNGPNNAIKGPKAILSQAADAEGAETRQVPSEEKREST